MSAIAIVAQINQQAIYSSSMRQEGRGDRVWNTGVAASVPIFVVKNQ